MTNLTPADICAVAEYKTRSKRDVVITDDGKIILDGIQTDIESIQQRIADMDADEHDRRLDRIDQLNLYMQ